MDAWRIARDVESMACTRTYMKLDKPIKSVGFSHDGRYLAYASDDALIDVADVRTGETVKQLACKGSVPEKLAWNPKHLAFARAMIFDTSSSQVQTPAASSSACPASQRPKRRK